MSQTNSSWVRRASAVRLAVMLLLALTSGIPAQVSKGRSIPEPKLPYEAKNKCPFEGCTYRGWTALKDLPVYSTWREGRQQTSTIRKGEQVTALGGNVVTYRPGLIHMDRDLSEAGLKRGDRILTYTYLGEGFSQAWVNGAFFEEFDISFTKWPDGTGCGGQHCAATYIDLGKKTWWAELRLKSGLTAWVEMDDLPFDGVDILSSVESVTPPF